MTNYGVRDQDGDVTAVPADADAPAVDTAAPTPQSAVGNATATDDTNTVAPSTAVGGPEVVGAAEVEASAPAQTAEPFDGTADDEARAEAAAEVERVQAENAENSRDVAAAQRAEDLKFATENPNSPVVRAANSAVGGESFNYGE